jgi:glycolate oxidase FAD binding subunit
MSEPIIQQWCEQIQQAHHDGKTIQICGNNSKVLVDECTQNLSLANYSGIIDYEPAELVVTVKSGTPLSDLKAVLAERHQMLAFEPPDYGNSTIGGTYACALTGPSKPFRGILRDFVLGTKLIDGQGRELTFGGKMIKNVAGYDVSRMLVGSKGSMAVVTQMSLKVIPLIEEITYYMEMPENEAILLMNKMAGTALPLSACAYYQGKFYYRVAGAHPIQTNRVGVHTCNNDIWITLNPFKPDLPPNVKLWRLDVESTAPAIENTIAVGSCGLRRWVASETKPNHPYTTLWRSYFAPRHNDTNRISHIKSGLRDVFDPFHVFKQM